MYIMNPVAKLGWLGSLVQKLAPSECCVSLLFVPVFIERIWSGLQPQESSFAKRNQWLFLSAGIIFTDCFAHPLWIELTIKDLEEGLTLPINKSRTPSTFICLFFASRCSFSLADELCATFLSIPALLCETEPVEKIDDPRISARLFLLLRSKLCANVTFAASSASAADAGSNLMPRPLLFDSASSAITLFFWAWIISKQR